MRSASYCASPRACPNLKPDAGIVGVLSSRTAFVKSPRIHSIISYVFYRIGLYIYSIFSGFDPGLLIFQTKNVVLRAVTRVYDTVFIYLFSIFLNFIKVRWSSQVYSLLWILCLTSIVFNFGIPETMLKQSWIQKHRVRLAAWKFLNKTFHTTIYFSMVC